MSESEEIQVKKEDNLQNFNVPRMIKVLSVIYIVLSIVVGLVNLIAEILEVGKASSAQIQYVLNILKNVITGFLFWGVGQVFEKFMEKRR